MVAALLILLSAVVFQPDFALAGAPRQQCLSCHPSHYTERGVCSGCHRGNPSSGRKNIAHHRLIAGRYAVFSLGDTPQLRTGERLIGQFACRRCHIIGGRGNRFSVNLDRSVDSKAPEAIVDAILHPSQGMPDFRLGRREADSVINALLAASCRSERNSGAQQQVVHFNRNGVEGKDIFSIKCGGCHRVLTHRLGSLGTGDSGPNLSGLLSPFYPPTFRDRDAWNEERLGDWLKNPRQIRPTSRMQPVMLKESELRELITILNVD